MSYFNHPVRVPVFQAAVFALVERLIRMAGRTESVQIQVLFAGDTACAVWSYVHEVVRGTIKLPALKHEAMIDREKANRWIAYVIHETWHVIFTSSEVWKNFCTGKVVGNKYVPPSALLRGLANAIEDARIERSGMELHYADGFKVVGKDLLQHMMVTGGMDVNPNDPKQIPWTFAVGCRGYGVKGERRLLSALDRRILPTLTEAKRRVDAIPATIAAQQGTMQSILIAEWAYSELKKLSTADDERGDNPQPPDNPRPPRGKPPEGGDRDDQPESEDDSEREPGEYEDGDDEGEPGEPSDEGTDGPGGTEKAPPLKVGDKVVCPDGSKGRITAIVEDDATVSPL